MSRETLKQARKGKGMTQQGMAEYLGISERMYKYIESGNTTGRVEIWDMLEDLLKIHQRLLRSVNEIHPCQEDNQRLHLEYPQF